MKIKKYLAFILVFATIASTFAGLNISVGAAWITGDNIAPNAKLTAWPTGGDTGNVSSVTNGVIGSGVGGESARWYAYTTDKWKTEDAYIEFEFPETVTIGGAKIVSGQTNTSTSAPDTATDFVIQYMDGNNWKDAAEVTGNSLMTLNVRFNKPASSKKFRYFSKQSAAFRIRELELYETIDTGNNMVRLPELEGSVYRVPLEAMANLGVIETVDEFDAEAVVTKEEFISYVLKLSGNDSFSVKDYKSSYTDVEASKYRDEIVYAELLGYIGIDGNEKFYPKKEITYTEAVQIILSMAGYDFFAEQKGGYPSGYLWYAARTGLKNGIEPKKNDFIVLGDVAQLLYNAITIPAYEYIGGDKKTTVSTGQTFLEFFKNIYKITGILYQTESFGIPAEGSVKGKVRIGNQYYYIGEADATEYVGYSVDAWYVKEKSDATLVYLTASSQNTVYNIAKKDVDTKSDFSTLYYYDDNDKERSLSIEYNAYVFKNRELGTAYVADLYDGSGSVELIDNDSDGGIDVIFINSVRYVMVASVGSDVIYDKLGGESIDTGSADELIIIKDGYRSLLRDIKEDEILAVEETIGQKKITIYASNTVVNGTLNYVDTKNKRIKIDDVEYKYIDRVKADLELGITADFYLDHEGTVVHVGNKVRLELQYGLLFGFEKDAWTVRMQIMDTEGNINEYRLQTKVMHNGTSKTASKVAEDVTGEQLVKYQLSKDGTLKKLYTAGSSPALADEPARLAEVDENLIRYSDAGVVGKYFFYYTKPILTGNTNFDERSFVMSTDTIVFDIPYGASKDEYKVSKGLNALSSGNTVRAEISVYDVLENGVPAVLVVRWPDEIHSVSVSTRSSVIIEKLQVYDEATNDVNTAFRMYTNGVEETVVVSERCGYKTVSEIDEFKSLGSGYTATKWQDLSVGDIIQYTKQNNQMISFRILAKAADLKQAKTDKQYAVIQRVGNTSTNYIPEIDTVFGRAYSGDDNILVIRTDEDDYLYSYPDTAGIYIYYTDTNTVEKATRGDIAYLKNSGNESKIFIRAYRKTIQDVVIVK